MESLSTNGGNLMTTLDGAQMVSQTVSNVLGLFLQLLFDLDAFNYEKKCAWISCWCIRHNFN